MRSPEAPTRATLAKDPPQENVEVEQKVGKKLSKRKLLKKKLKEASVSGSQGALQHTAERCCRKAETLLAMGC